MDGRKKDGTEDMTSNVGQKFTPLPFSPTAKCTVFAKALYDVQVQI
jgi:hypothetical protein